MPRSAFFALAITSVVITVYTTEKPTPSWIELAAQKGYVAAAASYRLAPKHKFPAMIEDARGAVRFLRANAKAYKIDPDKFAAAGFSASAAIVFSAFGFSVLGFFGLATRGAITPSISRIV